MRILILCHRLPYPPNKGDKIRSFHEIRHLAEHHQIHLLTFEDPGESDAPEEELRKYCSEVEVFPLRPLRARLRCLKGLLGSQPLTTSYFGSSALAKRVKELAVPETCDVLMVCGSGMAQYAELAPRVPRLLDMVDVDSAKWLQFSRFASFPRNRIWCLEARRLALYEASLTGIFDRIVLTTSQEVDAFKMVSGGGDAFVIRVGIDPEEDCLSSSCKSEVPTLVFTGQMDYLANVDGVVHFATKVLPGLREDFPDLRFLIVGRSPSAEVIRLSKIPGVTVTGEVEDVRQFLGQAWVFVAPLRIAQGVQIKVLQAMAMGVPAVVSERVMAGLADGEFQDGSDLIVATDDDHFTIALTDLLQDEGRRTDLAANARSKLQDRYCWDTNMLTLERHLLDITRPMLDSSGSASQGEPLRLSAL